MDLPTPDEMNCTVYDPVYGHIYRGRLSTYHDDAFQQMGVHVVLPDPLFGYKERFLFADTHTILPDADVEIIKVRVVFPPSRIPEIIQVSVTQLDWKERKEST